MKHTILCVDDEIDMVDALERLFRKKYHVLKATSAAEGLALLKTNKVSLIISDQRMPRKTGVEFLQECSELFPDTMRMLLTGYTDIESVIEAINSGEVYRYITKPWDSVDLVNTVAKAIEKYELSAELKEKNIALQAAYDELKTLDDAKNNFMILINHELKTPLTVILSFLELLKETKLDSEPAQYIDRIYNSSLKLKRIIDDVLTFVSAETGLLKLNKKNTSFQKLIRPCLQKFEGLAESKGQSFEVSKDDGPLHVDPLIVSQALERIIDNAVKFGDKKSSIEIQLKPVDAHKAEISVINKGKAIPPKTIDKILKPFTLDEDILKHSDGLGLGLSLTHALLKHHKSPLSMECPKGHVKVAFIVDLV